MLKELALWIAEELNLTIGTTLFAGFVPPTGQDTAVILIESGGVVTPYLPDKREKALQVLCRARDYQTARASAWSVFQLLHGASGITLQDEDENDAFFVNSISAVAEPQSLGQDERGNHLLSTNYVVRAQDA